MYYFIIYMNVRWLIIILAWASNIRIIINLNLTPYVNIDYLLIIII